MLTEPPAAPTAEIMIAMMAMPVTAPAMPAAAATAAVRRGLRRLLASPRPMAGSAAMTSKGARIGMTNEPTALNKPRPGTMAPSSRAVTATATARAAATTTDHTNRTGEYTQRRLTVPPGDASSPPAAVSSDLGFSGMMPLVSPGYQRVGTDQHRAAIGSLASRAADSPPLSPGNCQGWPMRWIDRLSMAQRVVVVITVDHGRDQNAGAAAR